MNNKKIQYINLLLPTILYFVLFMLEVVMGHGITKALFTVYCIVFIILFFVILFAVLRELYIINFVVAKDNAKVRIPGTMAFVLLLYFTFNELKHPFTVIMPFESIVTAKSGAVLTFVLLLVFNILCLMVYGFAEGKINLLKAPLFYIIVTMYALMTLAINNQKVEQNHADDLIVKIEEYYKEHGFNATVKIIPPVNNDMVNIKFTEKLSSGSELTFQNNVFLEKGTSIRDMQETVDTSNVSSDEEKVLKLLFNQNFTFLRGAFLFNSDLEKSVDKVKRVMDDKVEDVEITNIKIDVNPLISGEEQLKRLANIAADHLKDNSVTESIYNLTLEELLSSETEVITAYLRVDYREASSLEELLSFVTSKFNMLSKGALPDGMYLFDAYVLVPEKDNIKNDQQYLAVKVKDGTVSVYWQNR
ncbi:hypothetical protein [uncultured Granulicatella sp.]|uniref:hypothetical protein n=1 Tax=uncultured Granulicatella sp. TaxID=316089 RepID=UPI002595CFB5|nr:hypothetical protein [uncultured Granulicatella sp.]